MKKKKREYRLGEKVYLPRESLIEFWALWDHWMNNDKTMVNKLAWVRFVYRVTGIPEDVHWAYDAKDWTVMSVYVTIQK